MNPIFKKLNYKDQDLICVLNAPESFDSNLNEMLALTKVDLKYYKSKTYPFLMFFAENEKEFKTIAQKVSPTLELDLALRLRSVNAFRLRSVNVIRLRSVNVI